MRWLEARVAQLPTIAETLLLAQDDDVLEMDELVSFVGEKWFKRWLWTTQCRRTRQIVAFAIGYRSFPLFTDRWEAYQLVLPPNQHHPVIKGSGLTNHL